MADSLVFVSLVEISLKRGLFFKCIENNLYLNRSNGVPLRFAIVRGSDHQLNQFRGFLIKFDRVVDKNIA